MEKIELAAKHGRPHSRDSADLAELIQGRGEEFKNWFEGLNNESSAEKPMSADKGAEANIKNGAETLNEAENNLREATERNARQQEQRYGKDERSPRAEQDIGGNTERQDPGNSSEGLKEAAQKYAKDAGSVPTEASASSAESRAAGLQEAAQKYAKERGLGSGSAEKSSPKRGRRDFGGMAGGFK